MHFRRIKIKNCLAIVLVTINATCVFAKGNDILIADFESDTYGEWKVEGEAFGTGPATNAFPGQKPVKYFQGKHFVDSFGKGDTMTGLLISPEFTIQREYIRFLIGGGELPNHACLNLVINGKVMRTATGLKSTNGRNEALRYDEWNVADLSGKPAHIEIVDNATNAGGHILVDDILQTDEGLKSPVFEVPIRKHYLLLPVKNNSRSIPLELGLDGAVVREFEIELATGGPADWWAFCDVSAFQGKTLTIRSSAKLPPEIADKISGLLDQGDEPVTAKDLYHETNRPQFHYTVRRGFNNDPNGLVFFNGEFHMFYQNNPYGIDWGNMRWGHAVSKDLLHWTELGTAIYPHGIAGPAFSGGATVDHGNKSGFGKGNEDVLIASYTGIGRGECIAYGTNDAQSLTDIPEDPVLKHTGWDPNVMRYEPENKWLMVAFERQLPKYGYAFYDSTNLISWHRLSWVEGFQDCPDFFELPVEGEATRKWVLYGSKKEATNRYASRSSYMIGTFDGKKFTPETGILEGNAGPQFYAGQTFKNVPDGRRIMLGWLSGATYPGMPFSQGMTVPLELKLRRTAAGLRLAFTPAREVEQLHGKQLAGGEDLSIAAANTLVKNVSTELLDCELVIATGTAGKFKFSVHGMDIVYDAATEELLCKGTKTVVQPEEGQDGQLRLRVLVDRGVLEIFANDGLAAMSFAGNIFSPGKTLQLEGDPGVKVKSLRVEEMHSIWNN